MQSALKLVLAGIILCAVGLGMYVLWNQEVAPAYTPTPEEQSGRGVVGNEKSDTDPYDVLIEYTDEGFTPRDISIAKGTRVRFLNSSSEETWPASGIHPTHSLYPEKQSTDCLGSSFDSCRPLKKGEFFDFTFYYPGEWRYHDHDHAYQTGSITVMAKE